ncbi:MAG: signal peptidase II [Candidatus Bipolaricaulota bacterium]|nr:signal peptidase II [Candidatus Bipolaricaulota bacterium]
MRRALWIVLPITLVVLDRLTKLWAAKSLSLGIPVQLVGDLVRLTRVHNTGGAFGVFPKGQALFLAVSAAVAVSLFLVLVLARELRPFLRLGLTLVFAGAVGNLIDRAASGYVLDYFEIRGLFVFNVADACISVGAVLLVAYALWGGGRHRTCGQADRV